MKTEKSVRPRSYLVPPALMAALVLLGVTSVFGTIVIVQNRNAVTQALDQATARVNVQRARIESTLTLIESDMNAVVGSPALHAFAVDQTSEEARALAARTVLMFADAKPMYDQIRFLGNDGYELIRSNRSGQDVSNVPVEELQDKVDRYYVQEGLSLPADGWYISPLDLNVEHGMIEEPRKPVIRLVRTLDIDGERRGVVVLNVLGDVILDGLRTATSNAPGTFGLANNDGWWLYIDDPAQEWQFMTNPNATIPTLQATLGAHAQTILDADDYRSAEPRRLIAKTTIRPFANVIDAEHDPLVWHVVYLVDRADLGVDLTSLIRPLIVPFVLLSSIGAAGAYALSITLRQKQTYHLRLERAAFIDELTGLPNRRYLFDHLNRLCDEMVRYEHPFLAMFIDLDGFKPVNDQYGHDAGDEVLRAVAQRLTNAIRGSDIAARIGGDEFVVVAANVPDRSAAEVVAAHVRARLGEPIPLADGTSVTVGASIGLVGIFDPGCLDRGVSMADEIIRRADVGMYHAKRNGKNRWAWDSDA